jgi:hypothetical protein
MIDEVPGIGSSTGERCRSQAIATWAAVAAWAALQATWSQPIERQFLQVERLEGHKPQREVRVRP